MKYNLLLFICLINSLSAFSQYNNQNSEFIAIEGNLEQIIIRNLKNNKHVFYEILKGNTSISSGIISPGGSIGFKPSGKLKSYKNYKFIGLYNQIAYQKDIIDLKNNLDIVGQRIQSFENSCQSEANSDLILRIIDDVFFDGKIGNFITISTSVIDLLEGKNMNNNILNLSEMAIDDVIEKDLSETQKKTYRIIKNVSKYKLESSNCPTAKNDLKRNVEYINRYPSELKILNDYYNQMKSIDKYPISFNNTSLNKLLKSFRSNFIIEGFASYSLASEKMSKGIEINIPFSYYKDKFEFNNLITIGFLSANDRLKLETLDKNGRSIPVKIVDLYKYDSQSKTYFKSKIVDYSKSNQSDIDISNFLTSKQILYLGISRNFFNSYRFSIGGTYDIENNINRFYSYQLNQIQYTSMITENDIIEGDFFSIKDSNKFGAFFKFDFSLPIGKKLALNSKFLYIKHLGKAPYQIDTFDQNRNQLLNKKVDKNFMNVNFGLNIII